MANISLGKIMSHSLNRVWGDNSLVFQWGDFSGTEQETLKRYYSAWRIVLSLPSGSSSVASLAMGWFTTHFAALQDHNYFDRRVRIICCYLDNGQSAGCNATAVSLSDTLGCEQPTYAIHVNIHAVGELVKQARQITGILERQLGRLVDLGSEKKPDARNCALAALMFVLFHELAHIVRWHLEWTPAINVDCDELSNDARTHRKALELDADFIGASYCGKFIRHYFEKNGVANSPLEESTQGCFAVVAMYSMFSCLTEWDGTGDGPSCYYSSMARMLVVVYRLTETMKVDANVASSLIGVLIEGFKKAVDADPDLSKVLDFIPGLYQQEHAELLKVTAPRLVQLESEGRLKGWVHQETNHSPLLKDYAQLFDQCHHGRYAGFFFLDPALLPGPKSEIRRQLLEKLREQPAQTSRALVPFVRFLARFLDDYQQYERDTPRFFETANEWMRNGTFAQVAADLLACLTGESETLPAAKELSVATHFGEIMQSYMDAKALLDQDLEALGVGAAT